MKMRLLAAVLLVFGAAFALAQEKSAKLKFEKEIHDFGEIDKGEKVQTIFKFKNEGDAPLEIKNVATSCGCTSAKPEKTVYEPGESGEIPVTFDSEKFAGPITKRITVTTNDSENPKTVVTIKGKVIVEIESKPLSVFFPNAKLGGKSVQEIDVSTAKLELLEISNVKVQPEFLSHELKKVDDKHIKIILTADGSMFPDGKTRLNGSVTFDTNSKTQKTVRTPVTINIQRPVRVSPNSVYFFASKKGKKREAFLTLTSTEGQEFNIKDLNADLDYVKIEVKEDDGKSKRLVITLTENAPEGKFQGTIKANTDLKDQPNITIPIRGSVIQ